MNVFRRQNLLRRGAVLGALASLAMPALAQADKKITAGAGNKFNTPDVTMDQGERLTFQNLDPFARHNVFSTGNGADGKPYFKTPTLGYREEALVDGSQYLTTGTYGFLCNIHPFMTGTLHVTAAGQPKPRPGAGTPGAPDTTAPTLSVRLVSARQAAVRSSRELRVSVSVTEAATVSLKATTRSGGKTVTLGRGTVKFTAEGTRRQALSLTPAGRKALNGKRSVTVKVLAKAVDAAGNRGAASRTKRLSP